MKTSTRYFGVASVHAAEQWCTHAPHAARRTHPVVKLDRVAQVEGAGVVEVGIEAEIKQALPWCKQKRKKTEYTRVTWLVAIGDDTEQRGGKILRRRPPKCNKFRRL